MANQNLFNSSFLRVTMASFLLIAPLRAGKDKTTPGAESLATAPKTAAPLPGNPLERKRNQAVDKILFTVCEDPDKNLSNKYVEEPKSNGKELSKALASMNEQELDDFTTGFALNLLSTLPPKIKPGSDSERVRFLAHAATSGKSSEELKKIVAILPRFMNSDYEIDFGNLGELFQMDFSQIQAVLDFTYAIPPTTFNPNAPFTRSKILRLGDPQSKVSVRNALLFKEFSAETIRKYAPVFAEWGSPLFIDDQSFGYVAMLVTKFMRCKTPEEIKPYAESFYCEESESLRRMLNITGWHTFFLSCGHLSPDAIKTTSRKMVPVVNALDMNPQNSSHKENIKDYRELSTLFKILTVKSPQDIDLYLRAMEKLTPALRREVFLNCLVISPAEVTEVLTVVDNLVKVNTRFQEYGEERKIKFKGDLIQNKIQKLKSIKNMDKPQEPEVAQEPESKKQKSE